MTETLALVITEVDVARMEDHIDPHVEDRETIVAFTRATLSRINAEQPEHFEFVRHFSRRSNIHDLLVFTTSSVCVYEMIPERLRSVRLESCHFTVAEKSIGDYKNPLNDYDFDWVFEKLGLNSPIMQWISKNVRDCKDVGQKSDFILGAIVGLLPFLMRGEAEQFRAFMD